MVCRRLSAGLHAEGLGANTHDYHQGARNSERRPSSRFPGLCHVSGLFPSHIPTFMYYLTTYPKARGEWPILLTKIKLFSFLVNFSEAFVIRTQVWLIELSLIWGHTDAKHTRHYQTLRTKRLLVHFWKKKYKKQVCHWGWVGFEVSKVQLPFQHHAWHLPLSSHQDHEELTLWNCSKFPLKCWIL